MLKMLMEIALPKMGEFLVMMMTMIWPSGREVPLAESLRRRAKVLLPKFCLKTAAIHPESPPFIFFQVKMTYIPEDGHRRWVEEATTHQGGWRALVGCAHLVALLWYLFAPIFLKYSIEILGEF